MKIYIYIKIEKERNLCDKNFIKKESTNSPKKYFHLALFHLSKIYFILK